MNQNILKQARKAASEIKQQIIVIKDTEGNYYGVPAIAWITSDGEIEGMSEYTFVTAVDPVSIHN